jgi:hypothetical protein
MRRRTSDALTHCRRYGPHRSDVSIHIVDRDAILRSAAKTWAHRDPWRVDPNAAWRHMVTARASLPRVLCGPNGGSVGRRRYGHARDGLHTGHRRRAAAGLACVKTSASAMRVRETEHVDAVLMHLGGSRCDSRYTGEHKFLAPSVFTRPRSNSDISPTGLRFGLPLDRHQRLPKVDRSTDHHEITAQFP